MSETLAARIGTPVPGAASFAPIHARADDPARGILLLVLALALFSSSDMGAKLLNRSLPPLEIAWLRYAVFAALVLPAIIRGRARVLRAARPGMQVMRAVTMVCSGTIFILATRYLPLADATATAFVAPIFITALSILFLHERVGLRRWGAVIVGLIGVLIVVRPGTGAFHAASCLPLLSAFSWALSLVMTRSMAGADRPVTTLAYTALIGFALLSLAVPFVFVVPSPAQLGLGLFVGIVSSGGQWLVIKAYRYADASVLAPLTYTQLIWATGFGFLVFGAIPDAQTWVGAAVIVASGLYTAHRERLAAARR